MTTTPTTTAASTSTTAPTAGPTVAAGTGCCCQRPILGPAGVAALLDISERHLTNLRADDPRTTTSR